MFKLVQRERNNTQYIAFKSEEGTVTDTKKVQEHVRSYYQRLFSDDGSTDQAREIFFNEYGGDIPTVNEEESAALGSDIRLAEIDSAIDHLARSKSPGSDGLVMELFKEFKLELAPMLLMLFTAIFESSSVTPTQREAVVTLLYKKDDATDIKNWRPISLLNTDYKILTRILATRLGSLMTKLTDPAQTNCPGRRIQYSVHLIQQAMECGDDESIALFFDQEKAFDRISHRYIQDVLQRMRCGDRFLSWVTTLYGKAHCKVKVAGGLTGKIEIQTGVRQGDPLSPMLYVLALEPLLRALDRKLTGCTIHGIDVKFSAYADDLATVHQSVTDAEDAVHTLLAFEKVSNAKINLNKCQRISRKTLELPEDSILKRIEAA